MPSVSYPSPLPSVRMPEDTGVHGGAASGSLRPDADTSAPDPPRASARRLEPDAMLPRSPPHPGGVAAPAVRDRGVAREAPSDSDGGVPALRGMHLLQPHPALLRIGARHLAPPVLWLGEQMAMHPERVQLAVHAVQDAPSVAGWMQGGELAAGVLATGADALARQLQARDDPQALARIAQALVDLKAERLAGELLVEAIQGLVQRLPDRDVLALQLLLAIVSVMAHWYLARRDRTRAPVPVSGPPGIATAARADFVRSRSGRLDRVVLANAVVALHQAGQGILGEGYAHGVAESLSDGVRDAVGQWLTRARERR